MRRFLHFTVSSIDQAVELLQRFEGRAILNAGGTDVLGLLKDGALPFFPEALIDIKRIHSLYKVQEEGNFLVIGSLVKAADIARNQLIMDCYTALAKAACRVGSPQIREMATIGGNICQDNRCWYYRSPCNRFPCLRKGGGKCYAWDGDSRYHSIFGGLYDRGCIAVNPGDLAPALVALDAKIITTKRTIQIDDFFSVDICKNTVLDYDEIIKEIHLPKQKGKSSFRKYALRKSIDFPIVNCAVYLENSTKVAKARICLNAVGVVPIRAKNAENLLLDSPISKEQADTAGTLAISNCEPLKDNIYKLQISKTMISRTIMDCAESLKRTR